MPNLNLDLTSLKYLNLLSSDHRTITSQRTLFLCFKVYTAYLQNSNSINTSFENSLKILSNLQTIHKQKWFTTCWAVPNLYYKFSFPGLCKFSFPVLQTTTQKSTHYLPHFHYQFLYFNDPRMWSHIIRFLTINLSDRESHG